MNNEKKRSTLLSWLNHSPIIKVLTLIILVLLIVFLWIRVSSFFEPIGIAVQIIAPPFIFAILLYYITIPLIEWLEGKGKSRLSAVIITLLLLLALLVIGIAFLVPVIQDQVNQLIDMWPYYWENIKNLASQLLSLDINDELFLNIEAFDLGGILSERWQDIVGYTVGGIANVVNFVAQLIIVIFTAPLILMYLYADAHKVPGYLSQMFPKRMQLEIASLVSDVNSQLSSYIRGQILVAISVSVVFFILFTLIGLDYALVLSIIAGLLNLVPYLGSFIAMFLALIIAAFTSPFMVVKTLLAFAVEQFIEGRVISPQILGTNLNIHPLTILFILLVAARLYGATGLLLGVPVYAIIKVIVTYLFDFYKKRSSYN